MDVEEGHEHADLDRRPLKEPFFHAGLHLDHLPVGGRQNGLLARGNAPFGVPEEIDDEKGQKTCRDPPEPVAGRSIGSEKVPRGEE